MKIPMFDTTILDKISHDSVADILSPSQNLPTMVT